MTPLHVRPADSAKLGDVEGRLGPSPTACYTRAAAVFVPAGSFYLLLHDSFAVAWRSFVCDRRVTRRRLFWTVFPFVAWPLVTLV